MCLKVNIMIKHTCCFLFLLLWSAAAISQKCKITGKVLSAKTGEPLVGATVSIEQYGRTTQTDQNGTYTLTSLSAGSYTVSCSYVSFTKKEINGVAVKENGVAYQDFVMERAGDMSSVVVKSSGSTKAKETVSSLLVAQKNSASVSDGISAETIKKTPDRNTGDILKRVSGASLQEDKFAVIRGLSDRYNAAYINGAPLPSSESDRKAFAFDIFPSNMLDNLIIYKTATPDMPGEFAGGQIVINTKNIPAENFTSFSLGQGVNTIATFQPKFYYQGGQFDFLGIDNTRSLSKDFPSINTFKNMSLKERTSYAFRFPNRNWGLQTKNTLPNTSLQYSFGRNFQRNQKDVAGALFSISYNKSFNYNNGERIFYAPEYNNAPQRVFQEETFTTQTLLGAIANFSYKLNNNNNFSFKNIFSINSDDRVIRRTGVNDIINDPSIHMRSSALWFTTNRIYSTQVIGEHYMPKSKIRFNWLTSFSAIRRDIPALRRMVYDSVAGSDAAIAKVFDINPVDNDNTAGLTFFSTNKEKMYNAKLDISKQLKSYKTLQTQIKIGGYAQTRNREFNPRMLAFCNYNPATLDLNVLKLPEDQILMNIGKVTPDGKTGLTLKDITEIRDQYTASTELFSYYAMADQRFAKKFRVIYGTRVEHFHQKLNAEFNAFTPVRVNTFKTDVLPSVNLVYSLNSKQNIRAGYSKTLNRPEFRELAPFLFRDYSIRYSIFGDTTLRRASIDNFDLRYEFYPGKAQLLSFSVFHKRFTDPIELLSVTNQDRTLSYRNTPSAQLTGVEMEFRTLISSIMNIPSHSLFNKLTVFGNITLIRSKVDLKVTEATNYYYSRGRVMQGQSPYVVNAGCTYQDEDKQFSSTLSVNRYGQRIFLASNGDALQNGTLIEPNLWENGRTQLDFQLTKGFPKQKIELKLNIRDILAQQLIFFEDSNDNKKYDAGKDAVRSSQRFGRVINFTLTYNIR